MRKNLSVLQERMLNRALGDRIECVYPQWLEKRMAAHKAKQRYASLGEIVDGRQARTIALRKIIHAEWEGKKAELNAR